MKAGSALGRPMHFAYADPPYLGLGKLYVKHHPRARDWDELKTHRDLISRLSAEYPDGWAMSTSTPALESMLVLCRQVLGKDAVRISAWVKPFASWKPSVRVAYAWEPVIWRGGRLRGRDRDTVRDWHSENITLRRGLVGAKPPGFANWIVQILGADVRCGDTITDLFPGTGAMLGVWRSAGAA